MKDKYAVLGNEYLETIAELAEATGWSEEQAGKVLALVIGASEKKACMIASKSRTAQKNMAVTATEKLLRNYRKLKWSIQCGAEHAIKLLDDGEYQRLMEREESIGNQNLRSTAMLTAGNRVLWARLNTALDCFQEFCKNDPRPRVQRQYSMVYRRYIAVPELDVDSIVELANIDRSLFYRDIREATQTISVILFGADNFRDFERS